MQKQVERESHLLFLHTNILHLSGLFVFFGIFSSVIKKVTTLHISFI